MTLQRRLRPGLILVIIIELLAACGTNEATPEFDDAAISTSVAATQAAAAAETAAAGVVEDMGAAVEGDLQPLDSPDCDALADALSGALAVPVEQSEVAVEQDGKSGAGCQIIAVGSGVDFIDMPSVDAAMRSLLELRGWEEDTTAPSCLGIGGFGPGATVSCYVREAARCALFVHIDPADPALCPDDEPIAVCFSELDPVQIIYTIDLVCARDTRAAESGETTNLDSPEPIDLFFAPGDDSLRVPGEVPAGGFGRYVLTAMQGQEMTVNLLDPSGAQIAYDTAVLVIWGADGTVLISDHADALTWAGELPATQEYTIDVKSISAETISYILEVIIPPPEGAGEVFPKIEPFPFGEMQAIVLTGIPPMLPAEFPIEEGQPEIVADLLTLGDLYELGLEYGPDCNGAGACHYGTAYGKKAASTVPVGTSTFQFDIDGAQPVELAYGLTGYFTQGECGASCDDSRVRWVYGGYEYMIGLKGGRLEDVVALANAAILNSIP